jgi:hypothetical protein
MAHARAVVCSWLGAGGLLLGAVLLGVGFIRWSESLNWSRGCLIGSCGLLLMVAGAAIRLLGAKAGGGPPAT